MNAAIRNVIGSIWSKRCISRNESEVSVCDNVGVLPLTSAYLFKAVSLKSCETNLTNMLESFY